ncbi:hypothetical protein PFISCL1PPCAC_7427, partial [Pristionchus fissidentatus]
THLGFDASVLSELVQTLSEHDLVEDGLGVRLETRQSHIHLVRDLEHLKSELLLSITPSSLLLFQFALISRRANLVHSFLLLHHLFFSQLPLVG